MSNMDTSVPQQPRKFLQRKRRSSSPSSRQPTPAPYRRTGREREAQNTNGSNVSPDLIAMLNSRGLLPQFDYTISDTQQQLNATTNEGMKHVLEGGHVMINGIPLFFRRWQPGINLTKDIHDKVPVWVKIHDIPLEAWKVEGIGRIASMIGVPLDMDTYTTEMCMERRGRCSYAKVLIEISANHPWEENIEVHTWDLVNKTPVSHTLSLDYSWVPTRCDLCKVYDHSKSTCPQQIFTTKDTPNPPNPDPVVNNKHQSNNVGFTMVMGKGNKSRTRGRSRGPIHVRNKSNPTQTQNPKPNSKISLIAQNFQTLADGLANKLGTNGDTEGTSNSMRVEKGQHKATKGLDELGKTTIEVPDGLTVSINESDIVLEDDDDSDSVDEEIMMDSDGSKKTEDVTLATSNRFNALSKVDTNDTDTSQLIHKQNNQDATLKIVANTPPPVSQC
ncbi:hypothetical protein LXL04_002122 [Taraxacum kok-saghyz]